MSNRGFVGLANPVGQALVVLSALLLVALIVAGGMYVRAQVRRDQAERARMREAMRGGSAPRDGDEAP